MEFLIVKCSLQDKISTAIPVSISHVSANPRLDNVYTIMTDVLVEQALQEKDAQWMRRGCPPALCAAASVPHSLASSHFPSTWQYQHIRNIFYFLAQLILSAVYPRSVIRLSILMGHESIETTKKYEHFAHELIAVEKSRSHLDGIDFNGSIFTY